MTTGLTMLNSMIDLDFATALDGYVSFGMTEVDLKDAIFGRKLAQLDMAMARQARAMLDERGLGVYCLSTTLLNGNVEQKDALTAQYAADIGAIIDVAKALKPRFVRVNTGQMPNRGSNVDLLGDGYGWLIELYQDAIDRIAAIGCQPLVENEAEACFLSTPAEILRFFDALDRRGTVALTWDALNQWSTGVLPTVEIYEQLKPLIAYYHVKGGQAGGPSGGELAWLSALEDAQWPIVEITRRVVADGVSPVICLNPPQHGQRRHGYDYSDVLGRDVRFMKQLVAA